MEGIYEPPDTVANLANRESPLLARRGGRDIKKNIAKLPLMERTGWWFKIREKDPFRIKNAQTKGTSQRHSRREGSWRSLKKPGVGAKFRRQHGVGPYVLDLIEGSVHDDIIRRGDDDERRAYLESHGIRGLYFANRALLELLDYVVGVIRSAALEPPPRLRR